MSYPGRLQKQGSIILILSPSVVSQNHPTVTYTDGLVTAAWFCETALLWTRSASIYILYDLYAFKQVTYLKELHQVIIWSIEWWINENNRSIHRSVKNVVYLPKCATSLTVKSGVHEYGRGVREFITDRIFKKCGWPNIWEIYRKTLVEDAISNL